MSSVPWSTKTMVSEHEVADGSTHTLFRCASPFPRFPRLPAGKPISRRKSNESRDGAFPVDVVLMLRVSWAPRWHSCFVGAVRRCVRLMTVGGLDPLDGERSKVNVGVRHSWWRHRSKARTAVISSREIRAWKSETATTKF